VVYVVEQNRDAQMRTLLINELEIDPRRLIKVLHYDGTPITARFITRAIADHAGAAPAVQSAQAAQAGVTLQETAK